MRLLKRDPLFPSPNKKGISPEWANLPRRKCDDCGKSYKPVRPLREEERGFCSPTCRKSYHKHGGAYRKLRGLMEKMIENRITGIEKRLRAIVRDEIESAYRLRISAESFQTEVRQFTQQHPPAK